MIEYKGNLKVGDCIKVITDKSEYYGDECKVLYFTSQNRVAVRVTNSAKIDKHKGKKLLISIKSVALSSRTYNEYTKVISKEEIGKHLGEIVYIVPTSRSKFGDNYGIFRNYTTRDRLVVTIGDEYTTIARTNALFKENDTKNTNNSAKNNSSPIPKCNYRIAVVKYDTSEESWTIPYKLFNDDIKIGDYVLTSDFCTTCEKIL